MDRLEARVKGMVQGVGYRFFTQRLADALGLRGYARNLPNGSVEVVAEGDRDALESLLEELRRGPTMSSVSNVDVKWIEKADPTFIDFRIRY